MANFGRLTTLAEKVAAKLGYESAEQAEKKLGDRFVRKVEQESFLMRGGEEAQATPNMPDIPVPVPNPIPQSGRVGDQKLLMGEVADFGPERPIRVTEERSSLREPEMSLDSGVPEFGAGPLARRVGAGAGLAGGVGAVGYGATGSWGGEQPAEVSGDPEETQQKKPDSTGAEPGLGGGEPAGADTPVDSKPTISPLQERVNSTLAELAAASARPPGRGELDAKWKQLQDERKKIRAMGVDTTDLEADINAARKEYRETRDRNQLLESLQLVATAFGRLAGAQYGSKRGRYIGDQIQPGTIDYATRIKQAASDRDASLDETKAITAARQAQDKARYESETDALKPLEQQYETELAVFREQNDLHTARLTALSRAVERAQDAADDAARTGKQESDGIAAAGRSLADDARAQWSLVDRVESGLLDPRSYGKKNLDAVDPEELASRAVNEKMLTQEEVDALKQKAADEDTWDTDEDELAVTNLQAAIKQKITALKSRFETEQELGKQMYLTGKRPTQLPAAPSGGQDEVIIEAPNGDRQRVKRSAAQKYIDKGGKIVGQ